MGGEWEIGRDNGNWRKSWFLRWKSSRGIIGLRLGGTFKVWQGSELGGTDGGELDDQNG